MIQSRTIRDGYASFDGDLFNHIVRVLRLGTGAQVTLVDEKGNEHIGCIDQVAREWVAVKIIAQDHVPTPDDEPPRITICQALPKGDKLDLVLQKGTELGAHDFWLFGARRSVAKVHEDRHSSKLERWNRITAEAARQCGRRTIPSVSWYSAIEDVACSASHELRIMLWEGEHDTRLKSLFTSGIPASVIVAIGPEGGFEQHEADCLQNSGFQSVTLGNRILRTETAAIAITSILQYIFNDI